MKGIMRVSLIFSLLIMVMSCATRTRPLPEKYNLDPYLEEVNRVSTSRISDLENIDNQSVILRASLKAVRHDYYLFVLRKPIESPHKNVRIILENTAAKDKAYSAESILSNIRGSSGQGQSKTDFDQAPSNIMSIRAGFDRIGVPDGASIDYYVIEKIYRLKGKEQAEKIKEWLRFDGESQILKTHHFDMEPE